MLTYLELRVSCTACNSLIALYKIIIYKNVGRMPTSGRLCPISSRPCVLSYSPRRAAKTNLDRYAPAAARANTASGAMDENTHQQEVPPSSGMLRLPALLQMVAGQVHIPGQAKPVRIQNAQVIIRCGQRWAPPLQLTENINPRCRCQAIRPHRRHVGTTDRVCGNCLPHSTMGDQPSQPGKITLGHAVPDPLAQGGAGCCFFHLTLHCFTNLFAAA